MQDLVEQPARRLEQEGKTPLERRRHLPPSDRAAIRLIGAVLADRHDEWAIACRYFSEHTILTEPGNTDPDQPAIPG